MIPTVVVGAGGHGRDLQAIIDATATHTFAGFLDDELTGRHIIGPIFEGIPAGAEYVIGVNDPATRERVARSLTGASPAVLVHPSAVVGPGCVLGKGAVVAAGAVLDRDVFLGWHAHVHTGVTITRSWVLPFSTLCPGATVCGDVVVGHGCLIGAGATLANVCSVGTRSRVGAGATVLTGTHIPPESTAMGTPARV